MIGLLILIILLALAYHVYTCCMPKKTRMIWFYRDDCGHCVRMKPEWNKFESIYNGANVTIEKINIYEYADFANQVGAKYVPYIVKVMPDGRVVKYEGERTAQGFMLFANQ